MLLDLLLNVSPQTDTILPLLELQVVTPARLQFTV